MKTNACIAVFVAITAALAGCAGTKSWISTPPSRTISTPVFTATLTPLKGDKPYYNVFRLEIVNRSGGPLTVDWNAGRYLHAGRPSGRYVYRGIDRENLNDPPPEVIAAAGRLSKEIVPLRLIAWRGYKPGYKDREGFSAGPLPEGQNGILLVIRRDGEVLRETLAVNIVPAD